MEPILQDEMKQLEDQQHMEMMEYRMMAQHARNESHESSQQYNNVTNS